LEDHSSREELDGGVAEGLSSQHRPRHLQVLRLPLQLCNLAFVVVVVVVVAVEEEEEWIQLHKVVVLVEVLGSILGLPEAVENLVLVSKL
jgi:hypothetical protein